MKELKDQRIILTGASGGIGSEIARQLVAQGCKIGLVARSRDKLQALADHLNAVEQITLIPVDITTDTGREDIVEKMNDRFGGYDGLVNTAGIMDFTAFLGQEDERIEATFKINVLAPMLLCKKVIPAMVQQNKGHIVNIGSVFGSIGFAWFTSYSSTKFALRGFSQALRRELAETNVKVSYIAPRAVKTAFNSAAVYNMAGEVKMNMDEPEWVASQIVKTMKRGGKDTFLGFPESLFVKINAIFPSLVDKATRSQNKIAEKYV